jgi:long-chain acyl-CoA synthetase
LRQFEARNASVDWLKGRKGKPMNLAVWLDRQARAAPERPALFWGKDTVATYSQFAGSCGRIADWLRVNAVLPGDRVAVFMKNQPDYLRLIYGIWQAGAVVVPINAKLHPKELIWILEHSEARVLFCEPEIVATLQQDSAAESLAITNVAVAPNMLDEALKQLAPDMGIRQATEMGLFQNITARSSCDLAWLFYTSGTTGKPKGVMITHGMLQAMALGYFADVDAVSAQDSAIYAAPLSHGAGLYNVMHVLKGAQHVFPRSGGFDPLEIFELANFFQRAHLFAAPTMVKRMTKAAQHTPGKVSGLRSVIYGGGPMYLSDIVDATACFGPIFIQIYGQGECPMAITALSRADISDRETPGWQARLSSVGRAQSVVELQLFDREGELASLGQVGEIAVKGAPVMSGYWKDPQATQAAFKNGWLLTGDMGKLDKAGYLTLIDRSKDVIISGGSNIYPREVEEVLLHHPSICEVSVIGRRHSDWGEEVIAFVVPWPSHSVSKSALDQFCLDRIARFKRPKEYIFVSELPKNNYGKVLKTALRSLIND